MRDAEALRHVYEELADRFLRQGEARNRDHCLVLAADAALAAGHPDEAERLRRRLLQVNPHHLLRPYPTLAAAMQANDVQDYVADLRAQWPPEVVERLTQRPGAPPVTPPTLPPVVPPAPPEPPRTAAAPVPRKPVPVMTPASTRQTASPYADVAPPLPGREPDVPSAAGRFLADLLFFLGVLVSGAILWFALGWPFLAE